MYSIISYVCDGHIDANVQDVIALTCSSLQGRLDAAPMLLKHDYVDTNIENKAGSTALDIARKCGMVEIAARLDACAKVC